MKIRRLLVTAVIPMLCLAAHAQDCKKDFAPKRGDITLAATVGYNSYASISAQPGNEIKPYEAAALSTDWSQKSMMVGFEAGWFVSDLWKLTLGGGLNFTNNPGHTGVDGTINVETGWGDQGIDSNVGEIPSYRAVADAQTFSYNVFAGIDRYFKTGVANLLWYGGARVGMAYCQNQQKYDEDTSMGKSVAETWNLRGALTVGVDYFVLRGLYVGAQIDPFCYTYNMTTYKPQEGLTNLEADSHNFSLLAAPTLKIGFKF